jgi:hypothetical protein
MMRTIKVCLMLKHRTNWFSMVPVLVDKIQTIILLCRAAFFNSATTSSTWNRHLERIIGFFRAVIVLLLWVSSLVMIFTC